MAMQVQFKEIAASFDSGRFALVVDEFRVENEMRRDWHRYIQIYCVHERRLVSRFEVKDYTDPLHIALVEKKRGGVLTASHRGRVSLWTLDGKLIWARRDLRKAQAVHVIPHKTLEFVFGLWGDDNAYLILNPIMGGTRHRITFCTRVAASLGGAYVMASRRGRAAGTWLLDPETFQPLWRVLPEEAFRIRPGPDSFLAIWFGGYAIIDFSGAILARRTARGVLDAAWHQAGYWTAYDATVSPNEILAIQPDGKSKIVCRLDSFAGSHATLLAGGTMIAGSSGKVLDTSNGLLIWDFSGALAT